MRPYISTKGMDRERWLAERRKGIGGSDAPAIMGASPWGSPLTVYMDKRGQKPDGAMTEPMRQGVDFEGTVARRFSEETGLKTRRVNGIYRHPAHGFMIANIDRRVLGREGFEGLECKTTNLFNPADFAGGEIPEAYRWQCLHYMAVTGAKKWHLAVLVLSRGFYVFEIPRDEGAIAELIGRERAFWEDHVLAGVPPRPTGTEADEAAVRQLGGPGQADLSHLVPELDELARIRAEKSDLEKRIRAVEQQVRLCMGEREEAWAGQWHLTNREQARASVDTAAFRRDCPELYDRYTKPARHRVLRIRGGA